MLILFGSQTGNAEDVAERIGRKFKCYGSPNRVLSLEEYTSTLLSSESVVVFVCSTTGQGECPDNMKTFWKSMLLKSLPHDLLSGLKYCVIGLGDSSYDLYNVVAKKLNKRLNHLGASEIATLTLCDEQHELGYDAALEPWLGNVPKMILEEHLNVNLNGVILNDDVLLPPKYKLIFVDQAEVCTNDNKNACEKEKHSTFIAKVKSNERVTSADHFQAVHLIKFEIDDSAVYEPGDVASFMPHNEPCNVKEFLQLFPSEDIDRKFMLVAMDHDIPVPKDLPVPCTLRNCAVSYFDINSVPRRSFFDMFWHFCKCEIELEKLQEFTTAEGQEELWSYCNRPKRNILEVLQDFPFTTPNIPIDYLFDLIPHIRPRSFSIASSLSHHKNELHLLVAVVHYYTRLRKPRKGLCSTWLSKLKTEDNQSIPFSLKHGSIFMPTAPVPLIMVGPGTGSAPFRGFVQQQAVNGNDNSYLFFGCRYKSKDFLCGKEWTSFAEQGLLKLYVAFSRDQENKIYVQHKMLEECATLWDLIHRKNAHVYIAGNSKMPLDVKNTMLKIFELEGNLDEQASKMYLRNLETHKRLQIEAWS